MEQTKNWSSTHPESSGSARVILDITGVEGLVLETGGRRGQYKWVVTPGNEFPAVACLLMAVGGDMSRDIHVQVLHRNWAVTFVKARM